MGKYARCSHLRAHLEFEDRELKRIGNRCGQKRFAAMRTARVRGIRLCVSCVSAVLPAADMYFAADCFCAAEGNLKMP